MVLKLEGYSPRLSGICLVEGVGGSSNVYALGAEKTTIIDTGAGDQTNALIPKLRALDLDPSRIEQVVLTHTHLDHVGGLAELMEAASPVIMLHEEEARMFISPVHRTLLGVSVSELHDGSHVTAGGRMLRVIHTPGHTAGAICLYDPNDKILFSGDTVFPKGMFGPAHPIGGNSQKLIDSLKRLSSLEVEYILPGHMSPVRSEAKAHLLASYENAKSGL